jgi:lipopolysaccharide/colanic/teichoic acid biosynthesis glycosyltransferase
MSTEPRLSGSRPASSSRPIVLSEDLFRDVLMKERRRADRSNQSVALLLVTLNDGLGANSTSIWAPVLETLSDVAHDTDVLGWFEWPAVIGVIMPDLASFTPEDARQLESRLARELAGRSDMETVGHVSIRVHVHPQPSGAPGLEPLVPTGFPELTAPHRATMQSALKRALDIVGSCMLLLLLAPVFFVIALLVKLKSAGPVFFGQVRVGERMKPFTMLKFRTMYVNDRLHQDYMGRFLRRTSLDDLPQLWNVLRGDMSLVGPRPAMAHELGQYKPWHYRRVLDAKPGITGLWQVSGRSRISFDQMVRLDLQYARTCSLWTDIKILLATPAALSGRRTC